MRWQQGAAVDGQRGEQLTEEPLDRIGFMWTYEKALSVMRTYIDVATDGKCAIAEEATIDLPYGWVFSWQSRAFLESGEFLEAYLGNAPFIFNRVWGDIRVTGTARPLEEYLRKYEAELPPAQLQMTPERR